MKTAFGLIISTFSTILLFGQKTPDWKPDIEASWYYQLEDYDKLIDKIESGRMPLRDIYVIDMDEISERQIDQLQEKGIKVVAYFSAGTIETWRKDSSRFPEPVKGRQLGKFADEFYLDISADTVLQLMKARIREAAQKGFDGIEPDNVDIAFSYSEREAIQRKNLGFVITPEQQLFFNRELSREARENNLRIGLKNNREQIEELVADFDWSTNESVFFDSDSKDEYKKPAVFIQNGKPVLVIEYRNIDPVCEKAKRNRYFLLRKKSTQKVNEWESLCRE